MIRHILLLNIDEGAEDRVISELFATLEKCHETVDGFMGMKAGKNLFPQTSGKGFNYACTFDFLNAGARDMFLDSKEWTGVYEQAMPLVSGGEDGVAVIDIEI